MLGQESENLNSVLKGHPQCVGGTYIVFATFSPFLGEMLCSPPLSTSRKLLEAVHQSTHPTWRKPEPCLGNSDFELREKSAPHSVAESGAINGHVPCHKEAVGLEKEDKVQTHQEQRQESQTIQSLSAPTPSSQGLDPALPFPEFGCMSHYIPFTPELTYGYLPLEIKETGWMRMLWIHL